MSFTIEDKKILYKKDNQELGYAAFEFAEDSKDTILVTSTFVDPSLRGKGIASQLMDQVSLYAREQAYKVIPICSYAVDWFDKHPEAQDLLEK